MFRKYNFRLFITFLFFSSLIIVAISGFVMYGLNNALTSTVQKEVSNSIDNVALALEDMIYNSQVTLEELSKDIDVKEFLDGDEEDEQYALIRKLYLTSVTSRGQVNLHIIRRSDGHGISTATIPTAYKQKNYQDWGVFLEANQREISVVRTSDRALGMDNDIILTLVKAVRNNTEEVAGYVVLNLMRVGFEKISASNLGLYHTDLLIVDRFNVVAFSTLGQSFEGLGKLEEPAAVNAAWDATNNSGLLMDIGSAYKKTKFGFLVIGKIAVENLANTSQIVREAALPVLLLTVFLSFLLAALLARQISRPVQKLKQSMVEVQSGKLDARVQ